jgi:hypothetical protein
MQGANDIRGSKQLVERVQRLVQGAPNVRPEAVARGRALLSTPSWCHAREVADELVDRYVSRTMP